MEWTELLGRSHAGAGRVDQSGKAKQCVNGKREEARLELAK